MDDALLSDLARSSQPVLAGDRVAAWRCCRPTAPRTSRGRVVSRTKEALKRLGYHVDDGIIRLDDLGIPQTRRRHVTVASLVRRILVTDVARAHRRRVPTVRWAIGDLASANGNSVMNRTGTATKTMVERMDFLYDHDLYDLPNELRPDCHRLNEHSYVSVYGRLRWGKPAQTITSGFMCMGQGRFLHPQKRRTLTAREAARLQFIPDFHDFGENLPRTKLAEIIGNAVPPRLSYVFALELLR